MSEKKQTVIDVQKELKEGIGFRVAPDLTVGNPEADVVAKRDTRPPYDRWPRKVEVYTRDVPSYDGRLQTSFKTRQKCGMEDKHGKCAFDLIAVRAVNYHPVWDEAHIGVQLEYDFKDTRYYLFCYTHGPYPAGQDHW